jgi:hypothetical protein
MEAEITKGISSRFVCDWLYIYMWLTFVVGAIYVAMGLGAAVMLKGSLMSKAFLVVPSLLMGVFLGLMGISFYIICERGLKPAEKSQLH